ncbi:MAG: hypothetical protein OHK0046_02800 [Anaerolineae bacterium]
MNLDTQSASAYTIQELASLMTRAFDNYIGGNLKMDKAAFLSFIAHEGIDLNLSQVVLKDEMPCGLALVARRGWRVRLAAMGIVREASGQGVGKWFMQQLMEQARGRGEHHYELEVIEQNTPAVKLYEGSGFAVMRRLVGFSLDNPDGMPSPDLQEVDIFTVAQALVQFEEPDLPWQMDGMTIARFGMPYRAYKLAKAYAVISNPEPPMITLRTMIVPPEYRDMGYATRLLLALFAQHPGKSWRVAPVWPEEYAYIFEQLGFAPAALSQFQMGLTLQ